MVRILCSSIKLYLTLFFLSGCSSGYEKEKKDPRGQIASLIHQFKKYEPPIVVYHQGIPEINNNEITDEIIKHGENAIPELLKALGSDDSKIVLYSVFCLGEIGSPKAIPEMQSLLSKLIQEVEEHDKKRQTLTYGNMTMAIVANTRIALRKIDKRIKDLVEKLKDENVNTRSSAVKTLYKITEQDFGEDCEKWEQWYKEIMKERSHW